MQRRRFVPIARHAGPDRPPERLPVRTSQFVITVNTNHRARAAGLVWDQATQEAADVLTRGVQRVAHNVRDFVKQAFKVNPRMAPPTDSYQQNVHPLRHYIRVVDRALHVEFGKKPEEGPTQGGRVHMRFTVEVKHTTYMHLDPHVVHDYIMQHIDHISEFPDSRPFQDVYVNIKGRSTDTDEEEYSEKNGGVGLPDYDDGPSTDDD